MNDNKLSTIASWVTIVAGIVTFINFGFSVGLNFKIKGIVFPDLFYIDLPFRLISFIILEMVLAHVFGKLLIYIERRGPGIPRILLFVFALISAWTSFLAYSIAIYFVCVHSRHQYVSYNTDFLIFNDSNMSRCNIIQTICFFAMLIILFNA
jgi:hypothetical protein